MKSTNTHIPFEATHPGNVILDEIKARGLNQKQLAVELDIQATLLNEIIKGKRALTADLAILFERIFEIPADYWMRLQSQFEIDLARIKEKNINRLANLESWNLIKEYIPTSYFKKHGYLGDDLKSNINTVKTIYNVNSIDGLIQKAAQQHFSLHRKSEKLIVDDKNILAWNMLAQYESKNQQVNSFNFDNLPSLNKELQTIFFENSNTIQKVKNKMIQYGIKFVLIEKIEKAPIDGFTFWSDENPAIALTLRHKRIDNFAFTIMHELGHIDLHLKQNKESQFFDLSGKKVNIERLETEADSYAQKSLISPEQWNSIKNLPELNDYSIKLKSTEYKINPAIILGRLNHEVNYYKISTSISKELN
jgi:HTH-type transcriptional regulator/antitoxin HigA